MSHVERNSMQANQRHVSLPLSKPLAGSIVQRHSSPPHLPALAKGGSGVWLRSCKAALVHLIAAAMMLCATAEAHSRLQAAEGVKKVVLIAGPKSHGPVGNGIHDYPWSVKLLKVMLDNSNVAERVRVECHFEGWPEDPQTLDDADTIMVISDGRDGELFAEAPQFASEEHLACIERQVKRGCGFLTFHFSTFAPDKYADQILNWTGGYFDWETDGKRDWYSAIQTMDTDVKLASPEHPVSRGVRPFRMNEEFYFNLRFRPNDKGLKPLLAVPALPGREPDGHIVAWARERENGSRGFGTTCGHFYENWKNDDFRRLVLNAIVWTAGAEVPKDGVAAKFYSHAEITSAIAGVEGTARAVVDDRPMKILILTGHQYPGHKWDETTPVIKDALKRDPRVQVDVSEDIEVLSTPAIKKYDALVLNYCNWMKPGLSDAAKAGFVKYLREGGGLTIIHFANGAFHFSLPEAGESDWPEFRKICRRVWDHTAGKSGHDAYGKFIVENAKPDHPVMAGLEPFEAIDELYFRQQGDEPIDVLATARSQVTGQNEPMAFVYEYGKGKVFQTVLGHAAESLRVPGAADLVRRGTTWVAGRKIASLPLPELPKKEVAELLVPGRYGKALNGRAGGALAKGNAVYRTPPLTLECWAKLDDRQSFNILVANELKSSPTHWELFTVAGSGHLAVYLPGMQPDHARSDIDVCDGKWHCLAMLYEPERVRLFVDGKQVADQPMKSRGGEPIPGDVAIGTLVSRELGCAGLIDDVRLSRGIRDVSKVPTVPFEKDDATIGLWRLDEINKDRELGDESKTKNPFRVGDAKPAPAAKVAAAAQADDHFGESSVGFRWTEQDSVDNRWNQTDVGRHLASTLFLPDGPIAKGLSIRLGEKGEASICYDTAAIVPRAAWIGPFLKFDPARYGLINPPRIGGDVQFSSRDDPKWAVPHRWNGMFRQGEKTVLSYTVGTTSVLESPWIERDGPHVAFSRTLEVAKGGEPVRIPVGCATGTVRLTTLDGIHAALVTNGARVTAVALVGTDKAKLTADGVNSPSMTIAPSRSAVHAKLLVWGGSMEDLPHFVTLAKRSPAPEKLSPRTNGGPEQWTAPIQTHGTIAADDAPYVVDTLELPFENPYHALFFVSGHDFFRNGDLAVCTVHGDVWRVSGVDATFRQLTWKRFATGLYQPLGLKVVGNIVHVLGRDQITRLHDLNGDGEADHYENFNNDYVTSPGGHDYVACLETDSAGDFYLAHSVQGVVRVSRDGKKVEAIATGFRNPNGMGIGPGDTITVSPQEGNWVPASNIAQVKSGGHYGYEGPRPAPERPLGYDPPLCWIPRWNDNSSGGQVWATDKRFGPLSGQMLHLSFGKCRMLLVLRESVDGIVQGGTVDLPLEFDSGVMRGRVNPQDGQLYVSGLKGWVSSAVRDGCLQRIRYTGKPIDLPAAVRTLRNGFAITFTGPLDREWAEDPDNYSVQRWNYLYSGNYGSADYKVSAPGEEGHDEVDVLSATLLDERTVFLEVADQRPAMQVAIGYTLRSRDGAELRQKIHYTVNRVDSTEQDPARLTRKPRPGQLSAAELESLVPGLTVRYSAGKNTDVCPSRLVALYVRAGAQATPFLSAGPFEARYQGYIHVPLKETYRLHLEGRGTVILEINDQHLGATGEFAAVDLQPLTLRKGYNRIELKYTSCAKGDASLRLLWSAPGVPREPIPPTAFFSVGDDPERVAALHRHRGRDLFIENRCASCHAVERASEDPNPPVIDLEREGPLLAEAGDRFDRDWLARWLLDPESLRNRTTMPRLFDPSVPGDRQKAADIAAWLASLAAPEATATEASRTGEGLYEDLGCIACHRLTPPSEIDPADRISLYHVAAKFRPGRLPRFLQEPHRLYPSNPMPDFRLSADEAGALAAYLVEATTGNPLPEVELPAGDAERGRRLFQSVGCRQCHRMDEVAVATPSLPPLSTTASLRGCLAATSVDRKTAPGFSFTDDERAAIGAFLATDRRSFASDSAAEESRRLVQRLNCRACHERDGTPSPRGHLIVEEGSRGLPPETLPSLTWAGEKLHSSWTTQFLSGTVKERPRNWLKARMPIFPAYAREIARGFAAEHGLPESSRPGFTVDPARVEVGRKLTLKDAGLDCRQCHAIGREQPLGDKNTQIALGINFATIRERLRHDYFARFVLDPPRYDVGTRMPKLVGENGRTKVHEVYDGDALRQFESLWHFIQSVEPGNE